MNLSGLSRTKLALYFSNQEPMAPSVSSMAIQPNTITIDNHVKQSHRILACKVTGAAPTFFVLSVCLSDCPCVCPFLVVRLSVCLSVCLSVFRLFICPSVRLSVHLSLRLSIFIGSSVCLSFACSSFACPAVCLSICPSVFGLTSKVV